jgi:hypothetical protein
LFGSVPGFTVFNILFLLCLVQFLIRPGPGGRKCFFLNFFTRWQGLTVEEHCCISKVQLGKPLTTYLEYILSFASLILWIDRESWHAYDDKGDGWFFRKSLELGSWEVKEDLNCFQNQGIVSSM